MNWDAIGAVGEILGASAVFISLIYLAVQIRQSTSQQKLQGFMDAIANHVEKYVAATDTPEKAENFRAGLRDFHGMAANDRGVFHSTMAGLVAGFLQAWRLHEQNVLGSDDYKAMEASFVGLFRCPGTQQWWAEMKKYFPEDLVGHIDTIVADPAITSKPSIEDLSGLMS